VFQFPGIRVFQVSPSLIWREEILQAANHPMCDDRLQASVFHASLNVVDEIDLV
jgi:hypothetical protein